MCHAILGYQQAASYCAKGSENQGKRAREQQTADFDYIISNQIAVVNQIELSSYDGKRLNFSACKNGVAQRQLGVLNSYPMGPSRGIFGRNK
jgi:hypothetical protein